MHLVSKLYGSLHLTPLNVWWDWPELDWGSLLDTPGAISNCTSTSFLLHSGHLQSNGCSCFTNTDISELWGFGLLFQMNRKRQISFQALQKYWWSLLFCRNIKASLVAILLFECWVVKLMIIKKKSMSSIFICWLVTVRFILISEVIMS